MNELRIAIISFEHMHACSYAASLREFPGARLVAAADNDSSRLGRIKSQFPFIPAFYSDYAKMLDEVETDAVIVTSANVDHCVIALDCISRGKHILCEKPIATTVEDGLKMIRAAEEKGVKIMTAFPVRFSPAIAEAKKAIAAGKAGRILGAATSNHGSMPGGWFVLPERSGGGAVMDHTVHVVDLLRWLLEDEVAEVYAEYANRLHPEIPCDDVGQLIMRFRNGACVSLDTSWSRCKSYSTWGDVKLEIRGEKTNLSVNCFPRAMNHFDDAAMRHSGFGPGDNLDTLMIAEFLAAIHENREPAVTGIDGLRAVEVALAAYEAGAKGKVVRLQHAGV